MKSLTTILAKLLQSVAYLGEFAVFDVFLSVQEPIGDLVLTGVGHDGDQFLDLLINILLNLIDFQQELNLIKFTVPPLRRVLRHVWRRQCRPSSGQHWRIFYQHL